MGNNSKKNETVTLPLKSVNFSKDNTIIWAEKPASI